MRLLIFRSLWTNGFDLDAALADCHRGEFDGVEGSVPSDTHLRAAFIASLKDAGVPFIAEITTGGGYVPVTRDLSEHLRDFVRGVEVSLQADPIHCTVISGCDAWTLNQNVEFFGEAIDIAARLGVDVSFETHRSRSTYSPWSTQSLIGQVPELRYTCDFSHWCCVCERLVLDEESELLASIASRTRHIHARIGYEQGPQVPHPAAPEYSRALAAHERWWQIIWKSQLDAGQEFTTLTPEFGPDGYMHTLPFTEEPVAALDEVNCWMAARQRERFSLLPMTAAA